MKIKAVIFDLDGTLYNNSKLPCKIALHSLMHIRMLLCERSVRRDMAGIYFGDKDKTYNEFFKRIAIKSGKSQKSVSKWYTENYLPLQVKLLKRHFRANDWVLPTLDKLKLKGVLLACYSDYGFISEKLMAIGIPPEKFDLIIDAPSAGGFKPCKESLETVTKLLDVSPNEALVVGDREDTDGAGAKAANMKYKIIKK